MLISFRNTVHNGSLPDPLCQEVGAQSDTQRSHLRRVRCGGALQKCIEDPLSEVLIQGTINTRLAFIEVFLEYTKLYYRPLDSREARPCCCTRTRVCKFNWQWVLPVESYQLHAPPWACGHYIHTIP